MISCLVGKLSSKVKKALESSKPAAMAFLTGVDLEGRVQERNMSVEMSTFRHLSEVAILYLLGYAWMKLLKHCKMWYLSWLVLSNTVLQPYSTLELLSWFMLPIRKKHCYYIIIPAE